MPIGIRDCTPDVSAETFATELTAAGSPGPSLPTIFFNALRNIYLQELAVFTSDFPILGSDLTCDFGIESDPIFFAEDVFVGAENTPVGTALAVPLNGLIIPPQTRLYLRFNVATVANGVFSIKACYEDYANPPCWDGE